MSELPDSKEFLERSLRFDKLCQSVFGSGAGREILKELKTTYVDANLFQDNDRDTVYCIAQRDLVMQLIYKAKMGNKK